MHSSSSSSSYYDIDAILAEEELVPCTTLFDFSHLAHLDVENYSPDQHYLPEKSRIKMPLWAIQKWATLGFVRLSLPRHFARKARERLEADPSDADLRKRNERFFMSGLGVVNLMEQCSQVMSSSTDRRNRNANAAVVAQMLQEARELRRTLVVTYMGERFRRILDWSFSSVGDDVSMFTSKLTEMECRLFERGASAAKAFWYWKTYGNRRIPITAYHGGGGSSNSGIGTNTNDDNVVGTDDNNEEEAAAATRTTTKANNNSNMGATATNHHNNAYKRRRTA